MSMTELDQSIAQMAMPAPNQAPTHGLYVQFYMHSVQDSAESLIQGRSIFNEVEYVRIRTPGDKSSIIERPLRFGPLPGDDNNRFAQEYFMFKQGVADPLIGTPLTEWPQVTSSQVNEMVHFNVRTVEQLATMSDTNAQNFAGILKLREKAKVFLQNAKDQAPLLQMQNELESRDNQIETMMNQMQEMQGELAALKGMPAPTPIVIPDPVIIPPEPEVPAPKKRGRPRKNPEE